MHFSIMPPLIAIAYLLPGEVSLSLWLFYVLYRVQQLIWASCGITPDGTSSVAINPQAFIGMEEAGGFLALSVIILYQSRQAFSCAWRGLLSRMRAARGHTAPSAGQWALVGFVLANSYLLWWVRHVGMPLWPFVLVTGLFYTVMIGVTRLVAAAGTTHVETGVFPRQVVLSTIGASPVGPASLTMFSYLLSIYMYDPRIVLMAQAMNGFKLLHAGRVGERRFPVAALLAIITMLTLGFLSMIWIAYRHGASTLPDWPIAGPSRGVFGELDASLRAPEAPSNWLRAAFLVGASIMTAMVALYSRFLWWPMNPVGFIIASGWSTDAFVWSNALMGWALSTLIRRYGGLRLYRTLRPGFVGAILGGYIPSGALALVSALIHVKDWRPLWC